MYVSSFDNMRRSLKRHVVGDAVLGSRPRLSVLEVASSAANDSFERLFGFAECEFTRVDLLGDAGSGTAPQADPSLPVADGSADVVVCAEHTFGSHGTFWKLFAEMARVLADDGVLVVIAPTAAVDQRSPSEGYRFSPASFEALAADRSLVLIDHWVDPRGPSRSLVGVFRHRPPTTRATAADMTAFIPDLDGVLQNDEPGGEERPEHELRAGAMPTLQFLNRVHRAVEPRFYLEIGVFDGASMRRAACPAIGIDPLPQSRFELRPGQHVHTGLSADFFLDDASVARLGPIDLAYIDGMHLIENAYEDFVNVEAHAHPCSVILVDDVYPNHPQQALRIRSSRHWTGDVWRLVEMLREMRPDLLLLPVDTEPTGTLVVIGADPDSTRLRDEFDAALASAIADPAPPPAHVLERHHALDPSDPLLWRVLRTVGALRSVDDPTDGLNRLRQLVAGAFPRKITGSQ